MDFDHGFVVGDDEVESIGGGVDSAAIDTANIQDGMRKRRSNATCTDNTPEKIAKSTQTAATATLRTKKRSANTGGSSSNKRRYYSIWEEVFPACKRFVLVYGSLFMEPGVDYGEFNFLRSSLTTIRSWGKNLRENLDGRKLTHAQYDSLDRLGMIWDLRRSSDFRVWKETASMEEWLEKSRRVKTFLDATNVWPTRKCPEGIWIKNQRSGLSKNKLSRAQVHILNSLGTDTHGVTWLGGNAYAPLPEE